MKSKDGKFSIISGISEVDEDITLQKDEASRLFKHHFCLTTFCWTEDEIVTIM
jgi:hypothetical protein